MTTDLSALSAAWMRALAAANRSPATVRIYGVSLGLLSDYLAREALPSDAASIRRVHLEGFVADQLGRMKPSSVAVHFRSLRVFFKWLVEVEELERSPMERMRPPTLPEAPPRIPTDTDVLALLRACRGQAYRDRRDMAIACMLADTGMRLAECAGLALDDLDLDGGLVRVLGKGRRVRTCQYGRRTAGAVDHYLRARARHRLAASAALWLGRDMPMQSCGIHQALKRRAIAAGLPWMHCHLLRSYFAHTWLSRGGSEVELMTACGWRQPVMIARYTASTAAERSHQAHRRLGMLDAL